MSFLILLLRVPRVIVFLGTWGRLPFILNVLLSVLTGIIVLFLLHNKSRASRIRFFLVEESLSLIIILTWFLFGGGTFIFLFLFIKRALVPFHTWLISALSVCQREALVWGITVHKIPVVLFFIRLKILSALSLLLFRLMLGAFFLFRVGEIRRIVILSSGNIFSSLLLFLWFFSGEGAYFFLCYCFILWSVVLKENLELNRIFFFIGLIGAPPLLLFQIKWILLSPLFNESWGYVLILIFSSAVAVIGYSRYCLLVDLKPISSAYRGLIRWGLVRSRLLLI